MVRSLSVDHQATISRMTNPGTPNPPAAENAGTPLCFGIERQWPGASEQGRPATMNIMRAALAALLTVLAFEGCASSTKMKTQVTPFLMFEGKAEEAMNFYVSLDRNNG